MADRGWTFNTAEARWELLGADGEIVPGTGIPGAYLRRYGLGELNAYGARHGWPELAGEPWWQLALVDGPGQGRRVYLDPADCPILPIVIYWSLPGPMAASGDLSQVHGPGPQLASYRQLDQVCGHGRDCPFPYALGL